MSCDMRTANAYATNAHRPTAVIVMSDSPRAGSSARANVPAVPSASPSDISTSAIAKPSARSRRKAGLDHPVARICSSECRSSAPRTARAPWIAA